MIAGERRRGIVSDARVVLERGEARRSKGEATLLRTATGSYVTMTVTVTGHARGGLSSCHGFTKGCAQRVRALPRDN